MAIPSFMPNFTINEITMQDRYLNGNREVRYTHADRDERYYSGGEQLHQVLYDLSERIDRLSRVSFSDSALTKQVTELSDTIDSIQSDVCTLQDAMDEILVLLKEKK